MKFTMSRDRTVATTRGHVIYFPKNVPVYVPPLIYNEVLAAGGVPDEELPETAPDPSKANEPAEPSKREEAVFAAFEKLTLRGKREDFTAAGVPHPKALAIELGWTLHNRERDTLWVKFNAVKEEA